MAAPSAAAYRWHPSVDRLVVSAMEHVDRRHGSIGILMTGMGNDGARSMARLRAARRAHHRGGEGDRGRVGHAR